MRIERIDLITYGHYRDTTLDLSLPESGLTVVYGPNEAGKSTTRRGIIAALFGFRRDDPGAFACGVHAMRVGARVSSQRGTLTFVRQGLSGLTAEGDGAVSSDEVDRIMWGPAGGVGRTLYTQLFSIGHEELRGGSAFLLDAGDEVGRLLFGASLGSGSVAAVLRRLEGRSAGLYKDRGSAQQISRSLETYRKTMRRARESRVRAREWERRLSEHAEAEEEYNEVRDQLRAAIDAKERLCRVRAARPLLTRRATSLDELAQLGEAPSSAWADRALDALRDYRSARAEHGRIRQARERLDEQLAAVVVTTAVLAMEDEIDELVQGVGRYQKDTADLYKRRAERETALDLVVQQRQVLGGAVHEGTAVAEMDLVVVESLVRSATTLASQGSAVHDEERATKKRIEAARVRLAGLPEPPHIDALERVLRVVTPKVNDVQRHRIALGEHDAERSDIDALANRLGLGDKTDAMIEGLVVPAEVEIDQERERRQELRICVGQSGAELQELRDSIRELDQEIQFSAATLPDLARLEHARIHRDEGWRLVRKELDGAPLGAAEIAWAGGSALSDAYESAVADADHAADERYEGAEGLARNAERVRRRQECEAQRVRLEAELQALKEADSEALTTWRVRWSTIGVEAGEPEAMATWRRDHDQLVRQIVTWRRRGVTIAAETEELDRARRKVVEALIEVGCEPVSEDLELLVAQAHDISESARVLRDDRRDAEAALRAAEEDEPRRQSAVEAHDEALAAWRRDWQLALVPLLLDASTIPDAAARAVSAHRELLRAQKEVSKLERRIEGMENDRRSYVERTRSVASQVLLVDEAATPVAVVKQIQHRLQEARDAEQRRRTLDDELKATIERLQDCDTERANAERRVLELHAEVDGVPRGSVETVVDEESVEVAVERARAAARLKDRLDQLETDLLEQGGGRTIEEIRAEAQEFGTATLDGAISMTEVDIEAFQTRLEEAQQSVIDARHTLDAVSADAIAADQEQEAQGELARAAQLMTEFARTSLAAEVLRRTIDNYGERHRGPLLERASHLFRSITGEAFSELVVDADGARQVLLAKRRSSELCTINALSDGTRDELYYALRLASIEHQLDLLEERPPVVLDDVLIHFDDTRATAAVRALGALSERTQVILFTHHEQVVETVCRALPDEQYAIVRLAPRNHDELLGAASSVPSAGLVSNWDGSGGSPTDRLLIAAQNTAGAALTKAELLAESGVAAASWPAAIRELVSSGALVQEGQKRGARYRLPT